MAAKSALAKRVRYIRVLFGLLVSLVIILGLSVAYVQNTEIRSKAAEEQMVYKQWEFGGGDSEGWSVPKPFTSIVKGGRFILNMVKSDRVAVIRNSSVNADLPQGNKYIGFTIAAGSSVAQRSPTPTSCPAPPICVDSQLYTESRYALRGGCPQYKCIPIYRTRWESPDWRNTFGHWVQGAQNEVINEEAVYEAAISKRVACTLDAKICQDGTSVGRGGDGCSFLPCGGGNKQFTGRVYYTLKKSDKEPAVVQKPLVFSGVADGQMREIRIKLPEIGNASVKSIRIQITSGVKSGDVVAIDWIRLFGVVIKNTPTATPTVTCVPRPACLDPVDGGPVCAIKLAPGTEFCSKPRTGSCQYARNGATCSMPLDCPNTASRMACSTAGVCKDGTCIATTKPSPPPGCYYKQVQCIKAPCDPILVCPTPSEEEPPVTSGGCVRAGCSGELCLDAEQAQRMGVSTCIYREAYACYRTANCERQSNGACGWTKSEALQTCLASRTTRGYSVPPPID